MAQGHVALPQRGSSPRPGGLKKAGLLAGLAAAAFVVVSGVAIIMMLQGDGEEAPQLDFAEPGKIDGELLADLQSVAESLPKPQGATDRDQVESLMGSPDAFSISFEQDDGGKSERILRYETWFYFEFETALEFVDGDLLSNMPVDDVAPLAILPRQYDPATFKREMTWEDVQRLVVEPSAFVRLDMPEAYGTKVWAYYGEQLLVVFDEEGLSLVETYPLQSGGGQ